MVIGVIIQLCENIEEKIAGAAAMGFHSCQICCWNIGLYSDELSEKVRAACEKYDMKISSFWAGWSGPKTWNLVEGPLTLGLLPEAYRAMRIEELKRGADFAAKIGAMQVITHAGFIPENPNESGYAGMIVALKEVVRYCATLGLKFMFETGQETPVTLRRAIEDIGMDNIGINLDPANLMLYGKANPVDALDIIGKYVRDVHAKDGDYPTTGRELGREYAVGKGKVNFPALVAKLKAIGYDGALTIEREISGEEQIRDIKATKAFLETLI